MWFPLGVEGGLLGRYDPVQNAQQGCFGRKRIEPPPNRLSNGLPRGCQAAAIVAADDFSCPKQRPPKPVLDKSDVASRSSYYYFSLGVSFFQIPDRLRDFTQAVAPVNHRLYLTGFHEFAQDVQVFFARLSQHHNEALAYESRQKNRLDHTNQRTEQATVRSSADHDATPLGL